MTPSPKKRPITMTFARILSLTVALQSLLVAMPGAAQTAPDGATILSTYLRLGLCSDLYAAFSLKAAGAGLDPREGKAVERRALENRRHGL